MASPSIAAGQLQIGCAGMQRSSGAPAIEASTAIGDERLELANGQTIAARCTGCMVGQGDDCRCHKPADAHAMRWLLLGLAVFWALLGAVVRSCAS